MRKKQQQQQPRLLFSQVKRVEISCAHAKLKQREASKQRENNEMKRREEKKKMPNSFCSDSRFTPF